MVFSWEYLLTLLTSKEFVMNFAGALWQIGQWLGRSPRNGPEIRVNLMENPVQVNPGQKGTWDERKFWRRTFHQMKQKYPWIGPLFGPSLWFITAWWFGTWLDYDFPYIGNNHPIWLSYFSEGLKPPTRSPWFITMVYQWKLANKNSDPYAGWMLVEIKFPTINSCPHFLFTDKSPFCAATHRLGYGSALSKEWTLVNDYDWPHSPTSPSSIICPNICPLGASSQLRSFFRTSRIK